MNPFPERIVCLTGETTDILAALRGNGLHEVKLPMILRSAGFAGGRCSVLDFGTFSGFARPVHPLQGQVAALRRPPSSNGGGAGPLATRSY